MTCNMDISVWLHSGSGPSFSTPEYTSIIPHLTTCSRSYFLNSLAERRVSRGNVSGPLPKGVPFGLISL